MSRPIRTGIALFPVILGLSCAPGHFAALELDKVAKSIDKYGFASISTPFLAGPSDEFSFNLNKSADYFYQQAFKPQGGVRHFSARALDVQFAFRMNIEQALATVAQYNRAQSISEIRAAKLKAGRQKGVLEALVAANAAPEGVSTALQTTGSPEAAALGTAIGLSDPANNPLVKSTIGMLDAIANQPEPDTDALPGFVPTTQPVPEEPPFNVQDRLAYQAVGGQFTPGLSMPEGPFQISAREALLIAGGDIVTQSLLRWFLTPVDNKQKNYELFFCPVIVSVQPGYETRGAFQADITVSVDLARRNNGGQLEFLSEQFPHSSPPIQVAGVFPAIDSQVLELANSRRQLYSMAFQLSLLGFGSQANFFLDFAEKLEQDAQTQTALTVGSAYTIGSSAFGFRVEPKFVASKNPAALRTKPGDILESKTFPAMAVLLVHRSYLIRQEDLEVASNSDSSVGQDGKNRDRQYNIDASPSTTTPKLMLDDSNEYKDVAPANMKRTTSTNDSDRYQYLVFRTSVRWSPNQKSSWSRPRYSEVAAWKRAQSLDKAEDWIRSGRLDQFDLFHGGTVPSLRQRDQLSSRALTLAKLALDSQALVRVYHTRPADDIVVSDVQPEHGWVDQHTVLTIRGTGFRGNVKSVTVGGIFCEFKVLSDRDLIAFVPPWHVPKLDLPDEPGRFGAAVARTAEAGRMEEEIEARWRQADDSRKEKPFDSACAEVVIGAKCPVKSDGSLTNADVPCPDASASASAAQNPIAWIRFDKQLPEKQGGGGPSKGSVSISRDDCGRVTGVHTGEGGFTNAAQLLQLIADALCCEEDGSGDFNFSLGAQGGLELKGSGSGPCDQNPKKPGGGKDDNESSPVGKKEPPEPGNR